MTCGICGTMMTRKVSKMQKLHVRLSVEVKVSDKLFKRIIDKHNTAQFGVCDVDVEEIKDEIDWDSAKPVFEGWDNGGYIPSSWLTYDAVESGMYEADENGCRRKEK